MFSFCTAQSSGSCTQSANAVLTGHKDSIYSVATNQSGTLIVSGSSEKVHNASIVHPLVFAICVPFSFICLFIVIVFTCTTAASPTSYPSADPLMGSTGWDQNVQAAREYFAQTFVWRSAVV